MPRTPDVPFYISDQALETANRLFGHLTTPRRTAAPTPLHGGASLEDVGRALGGVSKERARQVQNQAIRKLLVYGEACLGRPVNDVDELLGLFRRGADADGVARAWAHYQIALRRHRQATASN